MSILSELQALYGSDVRITRRAHVSGGDINDACILYLSDGQEIFMKSNRITHADFFVTEAEGLRAIASTKTLRVPQVLARGTDEAEGCAFLLMEAVTGAPQARDFWEAFGHGLAKMHLADTTAFVNGGRYGFTQDNYIGAGEQRNTPADSWITFFREHRLRPQMERAAHYFDAHLRKQCESLLEHLEDLLTEPERPSLLHGDLWGGNFMTGPDGHAWLIDPAAYVGHAEADLAMTELFGGFHPRFYAAYEEINPLQKGYDTRRDIYNLYHLLNHLNLFGPGYLGSVARIVERFSLEP